MSTKPCILCVDDDEIVLYRLNRELTKAFGSEYCIETAESGPEGLNKIERIRSDQITLPLVIADYLMPYMEGDKFLESVHTILPNTRTILLTGIAPPEGVSNAVNYANLFRYITKPWETADLRLSVSEAVRSFEQDKLLKQRRRELEEANAKLRKLDESKNYLLSLLAHELYTPLTGINGLAHLIEDGSQDPETKDYCRQIIYSANKLRKFADHALLITRLLNEKYALNNQPVNISSLILESINLLKDQSATKNIILQFDPANTGYGGNLDPELIVTAFKIVLSNAIKFSPPNERIDITTSSTENEFVVSVTDKGPGFTSESLENLFQFFISDDLMYHTEGHGLGLAAAKLIMEKYKGNILVSNLDSGGAKVSLVFVKKMSQVVVEYDDHV